jgi:hypothetical protein
MTVGRAFAELHGFMRIRISRRGPLRRVGNTAGAGSQLVGFVVGKTGQPKGAPSAIIGRAGASGAGPCFFYNLAEGTHDATGNSTQGRYTVVFRGNWSQSAGMARTDVPQIELAEPA